VTAEAIAARQLGLITLAQALASGLHIGQAEHRVRTGRWIAVRPGVYLVAGAPRTAEQTVLAAVLAAGSTALASHGTAARLHGFEIDPLDAIEVTSRRPRQVRLEGVVGHRSLHLFDVDRTRRGPIPFTTAARTIVDLSTRVDQVVLGRALDRALRRRVVRLAELHR
jgi:hypothetical protein